MKRAVLFFLLFCFAVGTAHATTYYVTPEGSNSNDGLSWGAAWKTLTYAATTAASGDTIYVGNGTYNAALGETFPIQITGRYFIAETTGLATVDSGTAASDTINIGNNTTIEGLVVKNGNTSSYTAVNVVGSGAVVKSCEVSKEGTSGFGIQVSGANAKILNNTVTGGMDAVFFTSAGDNGLIEGNTINCSSPSCPLYLFWADNPIVRSNTVNNTSTGGSGIYIDSVNATIESNKVIGPGSGGGYCGIYLYGGNGSVTSNEVRGWQGFGFGILASGGNWLINKNTIVKNWVGVHAYTNTMIRDNIISAAPRLGSYYAGSYGIDQNGGTVTSEYNSIFNCETTYSGTILSKANDLTSCPRFVNADSNDYRLCSDSPCIGSASDGGNRGCYGSVEAVSGITSESWVRESDGNDARVVSTPDQPWRTITRALSSTEGTVWVRVGNYTVGESFPLYLLTGQQLKGYGTEVATVDSGTAEKDTINLGNNTTIEGLVVKNGNMGIYYTAVNVVGSGAVVKSCEVSKEGTNGYGIYVSGANAKILNNTVTGGDCTVYFSAGEDRLINGLIEGNIINCSSYCLLWLSGADNPIVRSNTFNNTSTDGDGIDIIDSVNATIESNKVIGPGFGGGYCGIWLYYGNGSVTSNEVRGWQDSVDGYGIYTSGGDWLINKNTLVKNQVGVYARVNTTIRNSIIASEVGGYSAIGTKGIYQTGTGGTVISEYNCLYANDTTYEGTVQSKAGDIYLDPKFVSAESNDFHLQTTSPCIDAGTPEGTDMGCYDYIDTTPPTVSGVTLNDTTIGSTRYLKNGDSVTITAEVTDDQQASMTTSNIVANLSALGGVSAVNPASYNNSTGLATWAPIVVSGTGNGLVTVEVIATDPSGNPGVGRGESFADNTAPGIVYHSPEAGGVTPWYTSDPGAVINIDFTTLEGSPLIYGQYRIGSQDWAYIFDQEQLTDYTNNWGVNWGSLANGENPISLRVEDKVGNITIHTYEAGVKGFLFRKETQEPVIIDHQSGDDTWRSSNSGTYDVDFLSSPSNLTTFEARVNSASGGSGTWLTDWVVVESDINAPSYEVNWKLPDSVWAAMQEGTNYVWVRVFNEAGLSSSSEVFYVKKDTVSPEAPGLVSPADGSTTTETTPTFRWNAAVDTTSGVASYEVVIDSPTLVATLGAVTSYTPQQGLSEGGHSWKVRAKDLAGNWGDYSSVWSFTIGGPPGPPSVVGVSPTGRGVSNNAIISITFSKPMDQEETIKALSVSPDFDRLYNWDGETLRIFPRGGLQYGVHYVIIIGSGARDETGNKISSAYAFDFTTVTAGGLDNTPPEILLMSPKDQSNVSRKPTVSILFSESMNKGETEKAISLPADGSPWTASWYGSKLMYVPGSNLALNTRYTVVVGSGAKDIAGNALANPQSFSFTTAAIEVDTTAPEIVAITSGTGVGVEEGVAVTFSEAIDSGSLGGNVVILDEEGKEVEGKISWDGSTNTVVFTPSKPFGSLAGYTVMVKKGIKDLAGNSLEADYRGSFSTVDVSGPVIQKVKFDGRNYLEGDVISPTAVISAEVLDASGLNYNEISLKMGERAVTRSDFKATDAYSGNQLRYEISPALGEGSYVITIEAQDMRGNVGRWEGKVRVYGGEAEIVPGTQVFAVPSRISPMKAMQAGEEVKVTMVYNLTTAADIDLHIYGPEGRLVWGRRYSRGTEGGMAGYNAVSWSGRDLSGKVVGNGLYVFKVIRGGRAIGQGVIVVLD